MCVDQKCETGCQMFEGGEIKHDKNCFHYPESRTKMYDVAMARIEKLESAMKEFVSFSKEFIWELNMEYFTASAKQLESEVEKFKQLLKQGQDGT